MRVETIDKAAVPSGWMPISSTESQNINNKLNGEGGVFLKYLPQAATAAERIIQAVYINTGITVQEAYLKFSENTFHLLLLLSDSDYYLPIVSHARLISQLMSQNQDFSMRVKFSRLLEHIKISHLYHENDYVLRRKIISIGYA